MVEAALVMLVITLSPDVDLGGIKEDDAKEEEERRDRSLASCSMGASG